MNPQNENRRERQLFQVNNPAFREDVYNMPSAVAGQGVATVNGAVQKTGILLAICIGVAAIGWMTATKSFAMPTAIGCMIAAFVLSLVLYFKPTQAPVLAPIYAITKGYGLGVFSFAINASILANIKATDGIKGMLLRNSIPTALAGTLLVTGVMLALYKAKVIRPTKTFQAVVLGATVAVMLMYAITFLGGMIWPALRQLPIYQASPIGIAFSVFVIGLAALNLILDFHWMEEAEENRLPKFMEWYTGWGLMVTIVWIYIEILRLLWKLVGNRN
jgi:uncharacterized YccA/Bax inhibitor family protein